ncbi:MAG: formate dehydrogenase subunit gamma [Ottowia sp.]|nr:formate dehydrogenase subunit gamma [Ottowia sp.]
MKKRYIERHSPSMRANHWSVAILFFLAGLSGFALFHPSLFFFTHLFGGPQWTRILHPYLGIAMFVLFLFMFFMAAGANAWRKEDSQWVGKAGTLIRGGDPSQMPPMGKFNGGQKVVFWMSALSLLVLLLTGITFWQAWFASSFSIPLQRFMLVLHALAAFVFVLTILVHIYAAIWVKGTFRAMIRGNVSTGWARYHHPKWYEEETKKQA